MNNSSSQSATPRERGVVLIVVTFLLAIFMAVGAMVFDLGYAWIQKRQMQNAADGGSLAGIWLVQQVPNATLAAQVNALAQANEAVVASGEVTSIQCGTYNASLRQFTPCVAGNANCQSCQSAQANSVRVLTSRNVPSVFGRLLGITNLDTPAESIAMALFPNSMNCVRPFGIEMAGTPGSPLDDIEPGELFVVEDGNGGPGNWGKLDIGGKMSSGPAFRNAMLGAICADNADVNDVVSQGTGFGGPINQVFEDMVAAGLHENLYMPKVTDFQKGNNNVTIKGFLLADFVSQGDNCGKGGRNWCATFRMVADDVDPPMGGGTGIPDRAHLAR